MNPSEDASAFPAQLEEAVAGIRARLEAANVARERALPLCRSATRHAANCVRAVHRGEIETAEALLERSRVDVSAAADAVREFPAVAHAGFLHDAQKEYAEASATLAMVAGRPLPAPDVLGVDGPAYLHGLAEAVGELRRHLLDCLRADEVERGERLLAQMDDIYSVLVSVDYPDAMTNGLRRVTDVTRGILEKTRGDLTLAVQQQRLARRLERQSNVSTTS